MALNPSRMSGSNSRDGPVPVNDPFVTIPEGEHLFFQAVRHSDIRKVNEMLNHKMVDVNMIHEGDPCMLKLPSMFRHIKLTRYTPLHIAVVHSSQELIELLVSRDADLNGQDGNSLTPLFVATAVGRNDVVKFLIDKGVHLDTQTSSLRTALMEAVCNQNLEITEMLVQAGCDLDLTDIKGSTSLFLAAASRRDDPQILEVLIKGGCNVNKCNKMGASPLMMAVGIRVPKIARALLEHGADVNLTDSSLKTALFFAVEGRAMYMMKILLQHGASVEIRDKRGLTPLQTAVKRGNLRAIELLLKTDCERCYSILDSLPLKQIQNYMPNYITWLTEELCCPRSLSRLSRQVIRKQMTLNLRDVTQLDIPTPLVHFLSLKDLDE